MSESDGWNEGEMPETWACPKCGARLGRCGVVALDGAECPVFQCETCTVPWDFDGETFDAAYTFAIGPDGRPFDPGEGWDG